MNNNRKRPSKKCVLSYELPDLLYRFSELYGITHEESADIFSNLKLWLWMCNEYYFDQIKYEQKNGGIDTFVIDTPLLVIDEMWHNFILYSKDYCEFCVKYFGCYLHHSPTTLQEKTAFKIEMKKISRAKMQTRIQEQKRKQYSYTLDKLGKDVFTKLYFTYPDKYSAKHMVEMYVYAALPKVNLVYSKN